MPPRCPGPREPVLRSSYASGCGQHARSGFACIETLSPKFGNETFTIAYRFVRKPATRRHSVNVPLGIILIKSIIRTFARLAPSTSNPGLRRNIPNRNKREAWQILNVPLDGIAAIGNMVGTIIGLNCSAVGKFEGRKLAIFGHSSVLGASKKRFRY